MILVKSLIVILLTLILAQFAKPFLTLMVKLFDGREGFAVEETLEVEEADKALVDEEALEEVEEVEEGFYSHQKVSKEANFLAELQDKMNELNQLSEKATEINNQLIF